MSEANISDAMTLQNDQTASWGTRLAYVLYMGLFALMNAVAWRLTPSASGIGTHEQLGLPACGFLTVTGWPCPSCGLTTSVSHLVHGEIIQAIIVQPFGVALYAVLLFVTGFASWALVRSRPLGVLTESAMFEKVQYVLLALMILSWVYKILQFNSFL